MLSMVNAAPRYFSTNAAIFGTSDLGSRIASGSLQSVGLAKAIIAGQAHDGGLYMPACFPSINPHKTWPMELMAFGRYLWK